ncbi:MAG: purine-binding chemotaxis protein CheW [Candidatus Omnitrophica bacterium]|nr:purine-binding chemotaxis protein CheW [Candidatus Omnitrophota bacterium]
MKVLIFAINGRNYGIGLEDVVEIIRMKEPVPVPDAPPYVKGVITLRGSVIPLIDMKTRLGSAGALLPKTARTVIARSGGGKAGLIVDEVNGVADMTEGGIEPAEGVLGEVPYLKGVFRAGNQIVLLLDLGKLLGSSRGAIDSIRETVKIVPEDEEGARGVGGDDGARKLRVLVFNLSGEKYCVSLVEAREVIREREITRVPNTPGYVLGVMNLRGEIVPVVDIRSFFGLGAPESGGASRIMVTDVSGYPVGIIVDGVERTVEIPERSVQAALPTLTSAAAGYTKGHIDRDGGILVMLDIERLMAGDEISKLKKGEL